MGAPEKTLEDRRSQIVVGLENKYVHALGGKKNCRQLSLEHLVKLGKEALGQ